MKEERGTVKVVVWLTIVTILCSTAVIVASTLRAGGTDAQLQQLKENKSASICNMRLWRQLSTLSGQTEQQRRANFEAVFEPEWLMRNCGFTEEEARSIKQGP